MVDRSERKSSLPLLPAGSLDAHTHAYPTEVAVYPRNWATARNEHYWADLVAPTDRTSLQEFADDDQSLQAARQNGLQGALLHAWYWQNWTTCAEQNDWHKAWHAAHLERLQVLAAFHPAGGNAALEAVEEHLASGFCGVGELHPPAQGYAWDNPTFLRLCGLLEQRRKVLALHITEPVGPAYPGRMHSPLEAIVHLAERFPNLPLLLAHWGGGLPFYLLNRHVKKTLRNALFDTAASPLLYDANVWPRVLDLVGPERICFGSDFPLRIFPKHDAIAGRQKLIEQALDKLPVETHEAIFGGNLRRLVTP